MYFIFRALILCWNQFKGRSQDREEPAEAGHDAANSHGFGRHVHKSKIGGRDEEVADVDEGVDGQWLVQLGQKLPRSRFAVQAAQAGSGVTVARLGASSQQTADLVKISEIIQMH